MPKSRRPWERMPTVSGTPHIVPLFPITCDCGVELHDFDEAATHECSLTDKEATKETPHG